LVLERRIPDGGDEERSLVAEAEGNRLRRLRDGGGDLGQGGPRQAEMKDREQSHAICDKIA
jgi:hypothetical protein